MIHAVQKVSVYWKKVDIFDRPDLKLIRYLTIGCIEFLHDIGDANHDNQLGRI